MDRTLHYHVGANVPGYMPESDVYTVHTVRDARTALASDARDYRASEWDIPRAARRTGHGSARDGYICFTRPGDSYDLGLCFWWNRCADLDCLADDDTGRPIRPGGGQDTRAAKRRLNALVRDYIAGYAADALAHGLRHPSAGDCWGCLFRADGASASDLAAQHPMGYDHILSHLTERYYVPSLLAKAMVLRGRPQPGYFWALIESDLTRGRTDLLTDELRSYFRKIGPALLNAYRAGETG